MSCHEFRDLLPAYLDDDLDEVRRAGLRAHLRTCERCREHALAVEPTLVFALASRPAPEPAQIEACVTSVIAGIRQDRLQRRLRPSRRRWLAAAAALVIAVIAAGAWWHESGPGSGSAPLQAGLQDLQSTDPTAAEETPSRVEEPPPRIELDMTQEEVRIYQYAIGDDASTGAVFIVNPAMEL